MANIIYDIKLNYETMKKYGIEPARVYVPYSLAGRVKAAIKKLGYPMEIIEVRPALAPWEKLPRCTYRTIKRDCAKRNR